MSLPREPRQLMINLMYLVLTAMLALNITREILTAFQTIDDSITRSNASISDKNAQVYAAFDAMEQNPSERDKVKPFNDKAKLIKAETEKLVAYLEGWKDTIIQRSGGYDTTDGGVVVIKGMEDINIPTELFLTKKKGDEVKGELNGYRDFLLSQVSDPSVKSAMRQQIPIQVDDYNKSGENPSGDWAFGTFHNVPVIGTVTMLSKFQNDVRNSESMILEYMMSQVHADDYKFDALTAIAVPKTSYALEGQEIEATVMLAAYNKSSNPTITSSAGNVPVEAGVGTLKFRASGVGAKTVNGTIVIDKAGTTERYDWSFDYVVGSAGASLQLDKMNVMYIGVDNPVTLSASGYNIEDVSLSIPGATVTADGKGKYNVKVSKQGEVTYAINAKTRAGGTEQVGAGKIRIKYIPPPEARVAGKASGRVRTGEAKVQRGVVAALDAFDFDARFVVQSFRFVWLPQNGEVREVMNNSALFNQATRDYMQQSRPGDMWIFQDVVARGPDNRNQSVNSITLTLF